MVQKVTVTNGGSLQLKFNPTVTLAGSLAPALTEAVYSDAACTTPLPSDQVLDPKASEDIYVKVAFPDASDNNNYQGDTATVGIQVNAVQTANNGGGQTPTPISTWTSMPGVPGRATGITALADYNGTLYAGAGDVGSSDLFAWNGSGWTDLNMYHSPVNQLEVLGGFCTLSTTGMAICIKATWIPTGN